MMRCLRAHWSAGPQALNNFLDQTFLGDGVTRLRVYLRAELAGAKEVANPTGRGEDTGGVLEGRWAGEDLSDAVQYLGKSCEEGVG